uniref:Frizzled/Smoothened transmembrane domain-containing protein n=1 Tax=Ditylenchus dipsaci TaxID=166011 RepID=A0A915D9I1_9BILA
MLCRKHRCQKLRTFVLGPLLIYFLVGVCFLSIGFLNLWGIRSNLKKTHPGVDKTSKLTQLMSKIGIYSVLYTLASHLCHSGVILRATLQTYMGAS